MKKTMMILVMMVAVGGMIFAMPGRRGVSTDSTEVAAVIGEEAAEAPVAELSLNDRLKLAEYFSVKQQEQRYVHHAAIGSFLIPGAGQWATGGGLAGTAYFLTDAALLGGSLAAAYYLTPADYREKEAAQAAMKSGNWGEISKVLPGMAIMTAGLTGSLITHIVSARGAADRARTNIDTGKVTFEPIISPVSVGLNCRF